MYGRNTLELIWVGPWLNSAVTERKTDCRLYDNKRIITITIKISKISKLISKYSNEFEKR